MLAGALTLPLACALTLALAWPMPADVSRVRSYSISAPSLHESRRHVRVYLPPSYDSPDAAKRRYPTAYILHGWPGSEGDWLKKGHAADTLDRLIADGRIPALIAIFPDGRGHGLLGRSLYMNNYDGASRVEQFVADDLVSWVDSTFRTERDSTRRAILGLSDGGTGAFNIAISHPDRFNAVGAHSSDFLLNKALGMGGVVGPEPGASRLLAAHSPLLVAPRIVERLRKMTLYFDCGIRDPAIEDNRRFDAALDSLQVPHTYAEYPGSHEWHYWSAHLPQSLEALTAGMR